MRILYLSDNFPPEINAAAIRVFERARHWVRDGHDVTVITSAPNFPAGKVYDGYRNRWWQRERVENVDVVRVKTYMAANRGVARRTFDHVSYAMMATLAGTLVARPDVVVATSPQFFAGLAGSVVGRLRRCPFVLELGDLWPASVVAVGAMRRGVRIRLAEWLEQRLYARATRIIALTDAFRRELTQNRHVTPDKLAVVYNGIDSAAVHSCESVAEIDFGFQPKLTVAYIGNHGMAHRLDVALDAAEMLMDDAIAFVFVGDGAEREALKAQAGRRGLSNVRFVGPVPRERIGAYWQLADVALVQLRNAPVLSTALPSKLLEAFVAGKPVVLAAPAGEATSLLSDVGAGISIAPEQPRALADALRMLAADARLLEAYACAARAARGRFCAARSAQLALAVVDEAVRVFRPRASEPAPVELEDPAGG